MSGHRLDSSPTPDRAFRVTSHGHKQAGGGRAQLRRLLSRRRAADVSREQVHYRYKTVRAGRRRQVRVIDAWQCAGWELVSQTQGRRRTEMNFRREQRKQRRGLWAAATGLVLLTVAGLLFALTRLPINADPLQQVRADAAAAVRALQDGDLLTLDKRLAANRGQADFAYFFTAKATPRTLGDALATVADPSKRAPLSKDVDPHAYDLALTDLAGTLGLATHGAGHRALSKTWTEDFIEATTTPSSLYGEVDDTASERAERRAFQDLANKQNLLLLLSRGYWSMGFLKEVTQAYWAFDHDKGDDAWPTPTQKDAKYAPAPNGTYLTDGMLALTAALTANPAASEWAFTGFQPGNATIDGSDYAVGKFTHYLLFEHRFPEGSDGGSVGMTAALTALSSAIDATSGAAGVRAAASANSSSDDVGPMHDSIVLQALADDLTNGSGCSWDPHDYLNCAKAVADSVWRWVQHWGHRVLDILSFAPPPFGTVAAGSNAVWYTIDGDYADAGLSLAAAVPGLAFVKIAKTAKAGAEAEKAAAEAADVAKATREIRAGATGATARELAEVGAFRIAKSPRSGYGRESLASDDLAREIPGSVREARLDPRCSTSCSGQRNVDIFDPRTRACIEVKKGNLATNREHEFNEVAKDLMLLRNKQCATIEWRFVPDMAGNVGPYEALRKLLQQEGIRYFMYLP